MNVLGIMWEMNSTAALMVDGKVIASASEERFSRVKNDERYPKRAIEYVLREAGLRGRDLDSVAFMGLGWGPNYVLTRHYSKFSIADNIREQEKYWHPIFYEKKNPDYLEVFKDKLDFDQYPGKLIWRKVMRDMKRMRGTGRAADVMSQKYFQDFRRSVVAKHLHIDPKKIYFIDHSTGHALYAYFASPLRGDALVATADAWGDNLNATLAVLRGGVMRRIYETNNLALARLYRYTTLILGMKPNEHEYKVMGLASYAKKKYWQDALAVFRGVQKVEGIAFKFVQKPPDMYFYFRDKLEGIRFDSIAGALQAYTEEMLLAWFQNALRKTRMRDVVFAGGVAMNVKANMALNRMRGVGKLYVNPTPDDASQAMGACYAFMYERLLKEKKDPRRILKPLRDSYLGPAITDVEIEDLVRRKKLHRRYRITKKVGTAKVGALLAHGKIIGRAAGRSEFGARALGNRSILADPRDSSVIPIINEKVKNRDFWMPFAPSILESHAKKYLVGYKGGTTAAYMTVGFNTTEAGRKALRAGLHPADLTCRPQVIPRGQNPAYEAIIRAFEKETGVGGLLNTSFNLHGEPIVQSASDALRVFELSQLDALLLNDTLIEKI
ncbi:hypothetical protein A3A39_02340 [Candidatus Kaiserbacteria bacterium RIFCSPLOWO2_01_FULL_54_13]|uniref:Carbamoyltransferase n=1 Tax=Candidatus Kaiserbacteria bacterium RIFCSPLOWO2_01_FULL_54_13 TaxID=1798512 RepID=A0A1F6F141_9BACT|nr:MAG: hypothetical protein A3A39_02340 [Candidatus Kaiserbacteria bacterium RIFCSPLOWO2_01_FULL_54_13]